jgi:hypothetical protein
MTDELLYRCLKNVFDSYIQQLSENPVFSDELGVLLRNSLGARVSEGSLRLLGEIRISTFLFKAHTTHFFQVPDLVSFSAMKNDNYSLANEPGAASVHGQIWKSIQAYEQTATSFTIRSCFHKARLSPNTQTRPLDWVL